MPSLSHPEISAGDLDKRVTLLKPTYNEFEDEIVAWEPVTNVWAGVSPNFAQETTEAGREVATVLVAITIRYRTDIDARWRIQDHEHTYEIKGMQDTTRRRVRLELSCQEVL